MKLAKLSPEIAEFCALVNKGIEAWVEAGKLLLKISEADSEALTKISAQHPHLTLDVLLSFERIGKGEIYPYLLVDGSPGARKLCGLPYSKQVKIYNGKLDVVVKRVGGLETQRLRVSDLTAVQATRVFDVNRVRTADEQKKLFEHKRPAIRISKGRVDGFGDEEVEESQDEEKSDFDTDAKTDLSNVLTRIHSLLLEARTSLSMLKLDSPRDAHISRALTEIGHLRLAVNESDL